jgi:hypothetical protein
MTLTVEDDNPRLMLLCHFLLAYCTQEIIEFKPLKSLLVD